MERDEVLAVLREKVSEVMGLDDLAEDQSFTGRGVDSLAVVELVMDLEDAFGIELTEDEVVGAPTIGALVDVVLGKAT